MLRIHRSSAVRDLSGQRVAIIGLGASGVAAARLAISKGGSVYASDSNPHAPSPADLAELEGLGASLDLGRHDVERIAHADITVASPGIPPDAPVLAGLAGHGKRWISEPELAFRFFNGSLIAVTGTNGKTTTALLTGHILKEAGVSAVVGGNVGGGLAPAACELARSESEAAWWVLELSSFQLVGVEQLRPDVAVVTNLAPDHLDRYPDVESYYADKARLAECADERTSWVLPERDRDVWRSFGSAPGRFFRFGSSEGEQRSERRVTLHGGEGGLGRGHGGGVDPHTRTHAYLAGRWLTLRPDPSGPPQPLVERGSLRLLGGHNVENALAASLAALLAGAAPDAIAEGLRSARPLPHRLEPVGECGGILWVNDSKATNVAAARGAVSSMNRPLVLIAGGRDKGEDFGGLVGPGDRLRAVVAMGEAGQRLARTIEGSGVRVSPATGLAEAVRRAEGLARPGDAVLLSPACSSFDEFSDYASRGRAFRELVRKDILTRPGARPRHRTERARGAECSQRGGGSRDDDPSADGGGGYQ